MRICDSSGGHVAGLHALLDPIPRHLTRPHTARALAAARRRPRSLLLWGPGLRSGAGFLSRPAAHFPSACSRLPCLAPPMRTRSKNAARARTAWPPWAASSPPWHQRPQSRPAAAGGGSAMVAQPSRRATEPPAVFPDGMAAPSQRAPALRLLPTRPARWKQQQHRHPPQAAHMAQAGVGGGGQRQGTGWSAAVRGGLWSRVVTAVRGGRQLTLSTGRPGSIGIGPPRLLWDIERALHGASPVLGSAGIIRTAGTCSGTRSGTRAAGLANALVAGRLSAAGAAGACGQQRRGPRPLL